MLMSKCEPALKAFSIPVQRIAIIKIINRQRKSKQLFCTAENVFLSHSLCLRISCILRNLLVYNILEIGRCRFKFSLVITLSVHYYYE